MPVFYWACNLKLSTRTLFFPFYFHSPLPPPFTRTDTPYCPISFGTWKLSSLLPGVIGDLGWFISVGRLVNLRFHWQLPCQSSLLSGAAGGWAGKEVAGAFHEPPLWPRSFCDRFVLCVHACCFRQNLDIQIQERKSLKFLTLQIAIRSRDSFSRSHSHVLRACYHPNWKPNRLSVPQTAPQFTTSAALLQVTFVPLAAQE